MRNTVLKLLTLCFALLPLLCMSQEVFVMERYYLNEDSDTTLLRYYLEEAYLPLLERNGARELNTLRSIEQEGDDEIAVWYKMASLSNFKRIMQARATDQLYLRLAEPFLHPADEAMPFHRMERILFEDHGSPSTNTPNSGEDTVFEFLSYGSPSYGQMLEYLTEFAEGDLKKAYSDSDFTFVFAGVQLTGEDLPAMGFLLRFENSDSRKEKWKTFLSSEAWQKLERDPEFQDNLDRSNSTRYKKF